MPLSKNQKLGIGLGAAAATVGIVAIVTKAAPAGGWCCPYCSQCFATYEELRAHVETAHPGERIPLDIEWD